MRASLSFACLVPVFVVASAFGGGCSSSDASLGSSDGGGSGASSGTNTVSGTVNGTSLDAVGSSASYGTIANATVSVVPDGGTATSIDGLTLYLYDKANTCTLSHTASVTWMDIEIADEPLVPGTYPVINAAEASPTKGQASADFGQTSATCGDVFGVSSTGGTVTVTSVGSSVEGSFDITFASGHITGTFSAPICASTTTPMNADGGTTCAP